ncbi:MAG: MBL fold metallo-hydrolase [Bacillota bacterium]|nr:MBL fold metallo-hydrolase [Bacillota bacterium]
MIEQVFTDIYQVKIPLPNNPLRATNSYFIRGNERNLIIDTGFNCEESKNAMLEGLKELNFRMENTDLFITHLHSDHSGLVNFLAIPETTVWMSEVDAKIVEASKESSHWAMFSEFMKLSGLSATGIEDSISKHPGYSNASEVFDRFTTVKQGSEIKVGEFSFQCVETRGHTKGHMCLYEPNKKILVSGDHILGKITPNITLWELNEDVLGNYLDSLDKIARLEIDTVFPGHRYVITDCRGRIEELKNHHERRMEDIINIVGQEKLNGVQVAEKMKWDLSYDRWEDFPWGQKLFATGEAMSHLYHLVQLDKLVMSSEDNVATFQKK